MNEFPEVLPLEESEKLSGHLWIQELPTGGRFRFHVATSGLVTFATPEATFTGVEAVPPSYRRAAELVSTELDREALRTAIDHSEEVTFFGRATRNEGLDYDWAALPPFVGIDVWSPNGGTLLSPDAATTIFERLGLPTLPAIKKELPAAHADLTRYDSSEGFPASPWRDGDATAVLIRDKAGVRVRARHPKLSTSVESAAQTPAALAAEYATSDRIEQTIETLTKDGHSPDVDTVCDRLIADIAREAYAHLHEDTTHITATQEFRSTVAERAQSHLRD